jgi:hypothetical protein
MGWYKAGVLQFQFQGTLQFNRLRDDPIKAADEIGLFPMHVALKVTSVLVKRLELKTKP